MYQKSKASLLVLISGILYSSSDIYCLEDSLMQRISSSFCLWTGFSLMLIFTVGSICSILLLIKEKISFFDMHVMQFLCLPLALNWYFLNSRKISSFSLNFSFISFMALIILTASIIFSNYFITVLNQPPAENNYLRIQKNTGILQIIRLWVCQLSSALFSADIAFPVITLFNIIVTLYKICNITFFSPQSQYSYLLVEVWTWVSLIISLEGNFFETSQIEPLYLVLLLLVFLILQPPEMLVSLFERKLLWNLKLYRQSNPTYYDVLITYYASVSLRKTSAYKDQIIQKLTFQFKYKISQILSASSHSSQQILLSYRNRDQWQNNKIKEIPEFLEKRKTFEKITENKEFHLQTFLLKILVDTRLLTIQKISKFCTQSKEKSLFCFSSQEYEFALSYKIFDKYLKNSKEISSYPVECLVAFEKTENLIEMHIAHEFKNIPRKEEFSNTQQILKYLNFKHNIKCDIMKEIDLVKLRGSESTHLLGLEYLVQRYIENNPFQARSTLKEKLDRMSLDISLPKYFTCKNIYTQAIFVSTFPQDDCRIKHCNKEFRTIMEYEAKKPIYVNDIVPYCMREIHEKKISKYLESIPFDHGSSVCFVQSLIECNIYETKLMIKIYNSFENELNLIGICKIEENYKYEIQMKREQQEPLEKISKQVMEIPVFGMKILAWKKSGGYKTQYTNKILNQSIDKKSYPHSIPEHPDIDPALQQLCEENKSKIDPLDTHFMINRMNNFVFLVLVVISITMICLKVFGMLYVNEVMNSLQNGFYRFSVLTQIYFPVFLLKMKIIENYNDSILIQQMNEEMKKQTQYIKYEVDAFLSEIDEQMGSEVIPQDFFQVFIQETGQKQYAHQLIHRYSMNFYSVKQSIQTENTYIQQQTIRQSIDFLHFIHKTNLFSIIDKQFHKQTEELLENNVIFRYFGFTVLVIHLVTYYLSYSKIRWELEKFMRKSMINNQISMMLYRNCKELSQKLRSVRKNKFKELKALPVIKTLKQETAEKKTQFNNFYCYKKLFILNLLFRVVIIIYYIFVNSAYSSSAIASTYEIKFNGKLQLTRFLIEVAHEVEDLMLQSLEVQDEWISLHDEQQKDYTDAIQRIEHRNMIQLLKNFTINNPDLNRQVQKNPCDFWINCSYIIDKYGNKPDSLIEIKNKMIVLIGKLYHKFESDPLYYSAIWPSNEQFNEAFAEIHRLAFLVNEMYKKDTVIDHHQEQKISFYLLVGLTCFNFLVCSLEYLRMTLFYRKYKKQIYQMLPLQQLLHNPNFSPQINQLIGTLKFDYQQ